MKKFILAAILAAATLTGCDDPTTPPSTRVQQAQAAQHAAQSVHFSANAEIDNIKRRLELTSNPGQIGFVMLINQAGQPIAYYSVKGKITSSHKRLESPVNIDENGLEHVDRIAVPAPGDEGTYGDSDTYVYFWTTSGQYVQWNGNYLYSDKPFRLSVQPLVISVK